MESLVQLLASSFVFFHVETIVARMSFFTTTNFGLTLASVGGFALGLPALFVPQRVHELVIPSTPLTDGVQALIRLLGGCFIGTAVQSVLVQRTEDIDSKRSFLQGASVFALFAAYFDFSHRHLMDPTAFKALFGGSIFFFFSDIYYGCLISSSSK